VSWQHRDLNLARPGAGDTAPDGDRDTAVRMLNEAFAEGRLMADEHGERLRAAFAARTWHDLARLTADLPGPANTAGPANAAGPAAGLPGGLDRCLLCMMLICCPPAGIAWLLAARYRTRSARRQVQTAGGPRPGRGGAMVEAGVGWRAEDR
jgi:hypothetical protein